MYIAGGHRVFFYSIAYRLFFVNTFISSLSRAPKAHGLTLDKLKRYNIKSPALPGLIPSPAGDLTGALATPKRPGFARAFSPREVEKCATSRGEPRRKAVASLRPPGEPHERTEANTEKERGKGAEGARLDPC